MQKARSYLQSLKYAWNIKTKIEAIDEVFDETVSFQSVRLLDPSILKSHSGALRIENDLELFGNSSGEVTLLDGSVKFKGRVDGIRADKMFVDPFVAMRVQVR